MAVRPSITIVGPGRLGSALAQALVDAGYRIPEIVSRPGVHSQQKGRVLARATRARAGVASTARWDADLVWICVPDREIASVARNLASRSKWKGKSAFHSSGALTSDELKALRRKGATVASVHPLMTFVKGVEPSLKGVTFGLEGDATAIRLARQIVRRLGANPFTLRKQDKVVYHAWGTLASPLLVALLATTEQVAKAAGLSASDARKKMLPSVRQTIDNYASLGPEDALTGPLVRGDTEIVNKHLRALKKMPDSKAVYIALARAALAHLPARNRRDLEKALKK